MSVIIKLGKKASSFSDASTGVNLSGRDVIEITDAQAKSKNIVQALGGGHIVRANKFDLQSFKNFLKESSTTEIPVSNKDAEKLVKSLKEKLAQATGENAELKQQLLEAGKKEEKTEGPDFDSMGDEELVDYYKSAYEVTKEDLKTFLKFTTEEKIAELKSLEES